MTDSATGIHAIFTAEDEKILTQQALLCHGNYAGDNETRLLMRAMARKILSMTTHTLEPMDLDRWLDSPVYVLRVGTRTRNVLDLNNFPTVRSVFEAGYERMTNYRGFGARCRHELEEIFQEYGLRWPAEPTTLPPFGPVPDANEPEVLVPLTLLSELLLAARQNFDRYEKDYGRFASRGPKRPEYDRLQDLVARTQALVDGASK
ncbi:TPA: hypothetical protein JK846_003625 [Escherichia coli]|nr:hypothetical protein [Salmonella enterica]HAV7961510.1 hypothetical protein [Escherichia coli]